MTVTYRIIKSVRSLAIEGMADFLYDDDIVIKWAKERQIVFMSHAQRLSELEHIDSMAHDIRTDKWDGSANPCNLHKDMLDLFIMRIESPLNPPQSKNQSIKTEEDQKWQRALNAFKAHEERSTPYSSDDDMDPKSDASAFSIVHPNATISPKINNATSNRKVSPGLEVRMKRIKSHTDVRPLISHSDKKIDNNLPPEDWCEKLEKEVRKKFGKFHDLSKARKLAYYFMRSHCPKINGKPIEICVDQVSYDLCLAQIR